MTRNAMGSKAHSKAVLTQHTYQRLGIGKCDDFSALYTKYSDTVWATVTVEGLSLRHAYMQMPKCLYIAASNISYPQHHISLEFSKCQFVHQAESQLRML